MRVRGEGEGGKGEGVYNGSSLACSLNGDLNENVPSAIRYELFLRTHERLMIWKTGVLRCLANRDALCMQAHCLRHLDIELRVFGSLALCQRIGHWTRLMPVRMANNLRMQLVLPRAHNDVHSDGILTSGARPTSLPALMHFQPCCSPLVLRCTTCEQRRRRLVEHSLEGCA